MKTGRTLEIKDKIKREPNTVSFHKNRQKNLSPIRKLRIPAPIVDDKVQTARPELLVSINGKW